MKKLLFVVFAVVISAACGTEYLEATLSVLEARQKTLPAGEPSARMTRANRAADNGPTSFREPQRGFAEDRAK
ncbi:MAG: hypothetical protein LAO31_13785 [Acidobacteriia bacterium]|nr:hypothetical protein [Terriglobia bacterium]